MLTSPDPTDDMPMLTALDPTDGMAFLTTPGPTKVPRTVFLTTPDSKAGPVEGCRPSVPGSTGDGLNLCPIGAADSVLVTATGSETSETRIPTSRTTQKDLSSRLKTSQNPPHEGCRCSTTSPTNRSCIPTSLSSLNHSCLSALGSAEEWHLNLCPMASYDVPAAAASPGSAEGHINLCPMASYDIVVVGVVVVVAVAVAAASSGSAGEDHDLNLCPMVIYYVFAAANPMVKDEGCPILSTPC